MIGIFLRNTDNELCFVQGEKEMNIGSFHYTPAAKMMTVVMKDNSEEIITSEIAPEISEVFKPNSPILVAHVDLKGELEHEYWAQLTVG